MYEAIKYAYCCWTLLGWPTIVFITDYYAAAEIDTDVQKGKMFQQTLCRDFKYCQPCVFVYLKGFRSHLREITLVEIKKIAKLLLVRSKAL